MKRFLLLVSVLIPGLVLAGFSDVFPGNPHKEAIEYLQLQGIVKGYEDGTYNPRGFINRAEFTKILVVSTFSSEEIVDCDASRMPFEDISPEVWFRPYVCKAYESELVKGYDDGTFRPAQNIKVPEAIKMVAKAFLEQDWVAGDPWYKPFVEALAMKRSIPTEIVGIGEDLTRAQMAEIIHRLRLGIEEKGSHSFESLQGEGNPFPAQGEQSFEQKFLDMGLQTNTAQSLIPIGEVLNGGPKKDGIPALKNPEYVSMDEITWLEDDSLGVLVKLHGEIYFYPYDVLYWHEIINDTVGYTNFAVTFCPLCGSAIVYDRNVDDETYIFGVSGKLWQSNLLMYDTQTESLWSQIEGKAIVGEKARTQLQVIPSDVVSYEDVKAHYPKAQILGRNTGYNRAYGSNPYGTYESDELLIFPIDTRDESFHPKTLFIAGDYAGINFALHRKDFLEVREVDFNIAGESLVARLENDTTIVVTSSKGERIATYTTMWFSWANHHKDLDAVIWSHNN